MSTLCNHNTDEPMLKRPNHKPPDLRKLHPADARKMCRFCLQPQLPDTMQTPSMVASDDKMSEGDVRHGSGRLMPAVRSWHASDMGLMYAQLSGGEQVSAFP